ncbi:hypothetical protein RSOL_287140, partial [Rhizoctonia solani AG-3 Rhs1AP]
MCGRLQLSERISRHVLKCHLEHIELEDEDVGLEDGDEAGARNLTALAAQFNQALADDNDEDGREVLEEELPEVEDIVANRACARPRRLCLYFSKVHAVPLSEVFNFARSDSVDSIEEGLRVYWNCGVVNLGKECDIYEDIASMRK